MEKSAKHVSPLLWVFSIIFVFFIKPLFLNVSFQDPANFHYDLMWGIPTLVNIVSSFYDTAHTPFWYIHQNMGVPIAGWYLPAIFHPLVLLFGGFKVGTTTALLSFFNMELLALFSFLVFRRAGASEWGSAAAALLAAFSGFIPWLNAVYEIANALPWIMCWLWTCMEINDRPRLSFFAGNAVAVFFLLISGDAQLVVLSAYLLPAWLLLYVLKARYPIKTIARSLLLLSAAAATAWVMSSCQIIPAMLFFDKAVTTRTPELAEYLNTYPRPHEILLAGAGLFTRTFRSLFLPFSLLLLVLCGLFRKRRNPAVFASLVLGGLALIMVIGGRWGLGSIPFSLPMLKSFIRHYRLGLALQAPLLIIAAVGFDELILCLQEPSRRWKILGLLCLALTLPMAGSIAFAALLAAVSAYVVFAVYRKRTNYLALAVFALIALDLAGFAWKTPYPLNLPDYDPVYEKYVEKLGHKGRVQGMYPWTARAGSKFDHPLPVHGTGYQGENSIDSWFQYPLTNHAYFLAAICPEVAEISGGVFSNLDFSTCFKSTDFVNESNRDLVNLAAIRYFFLQDFALEEADLYPLLSDPRYLANPARPGAFQPFKRLPQGTYKLKEVKKTFGSSRPVLEASKPGLFTYERTVEPQTVLETYLAWLPRSLATTAKEKCRPDRKTGNALHPRAKSGSWGILTYEAQGSLQLLQARAADVGSKGRIKTKGALLPSSEQKAKLQFIHFPATGPGKEAVFYWIDPRLWNHANSIKYREGKRVMVYENFESMGRTRIVHQARRAPNNEKALEMMRSSEYNPSAETIVMSGRAPLLEGPAPYREEHSRIVEQFQDEVVVKANLSKKGYLVLADTYYPGWRAYNEEGEELVIHRADLNLKAVFLSEGTSTVRFVFQPVHVRVGIFVTISSLLFLVMAVSIRGLIKRKKG